MIEPFSKNYSAGLLEVARACGVFTANELTLLDEDCQFYGEEVVHDQNQDEFIKVYVERGKVLGFIHYGLAAITDRTWYLYWIAVDPQAGSKGIGTQLLSAMEEHLRELLGRMALIETSSQPAFARPREFYLRQGYRLAAQINDFYSDGDHKFIYAKKLAQPELKISLPAEERGLDWPK